MGKVRPPFDSGVVGDKEAFGAVNPTDPSDQTARGKCSLSIELMPGQGREFQERRAWVEDPLNSLPGEELAPGAMALDAFFSASPLHFFEMFLELLG